MNNASNPEPNRPQPGKNRVVGPLLAFGILIMGFSIIQPFQMTGQASGGAEGSGCGGEVVGDLEEAKSPDHPEPMPPPQPDLEHSTSQAIIEPTFVVGDKLTPIAVGPSDVYGVFDISESGKLNKRFTKTYVDISPNGEFVAVGFESKSSPASNHVRILKKDGFDWLEDFVYHPFELNELLALNNDATPATKAEFLQNTVASISLYVDLNQTPIAQIGPAVYQRLSGTWIFDSEKTLEANQAINDYTRKKVVEALDGKLKIIASNIDQRLFQNIVKGAFGEVKVGGQGMARSINRDVIISGGNGFAFLVPSCGIGFEPKLQNNTINCLPCSNHANLKGSCEDLFAAEDLRNVNDGKKMKITSDRKLRPESSWRNYDW